MTFKHHKSLSEDMILPVHSLERNCLEVNILPLDHRNPYDYKRKHRHTYFEIMLVEKGPCSQLIDFINYTCTDYSCYVICPQQVHLMNRANASGILLQFTEDRIRSTELRAAMKQLSFQDSDACIFEGNQERFRDLQFLLSLIHRQIISGEKNETLTSTFLIEAFIALMIASRQPQKKDTPDKEKMLISDFFIMLEKHYKENKEVKFFIDKLGISEKKLSSVTKKYLGISPLQVIHNRILLEAKRLLLFEETSHKEIAFDLGFDSPSSFSAFIKSKTGYSPSMLTAQLTEIHK